MILEKKFWKRGEGFCGVKITRLDILKVTPVFSLMIKSIKIKLFYSAL